MRVLPRFLYRAPLLPVGAPLEGPLADEALAIGRVVPEARAAYARRAAFRATPHGLWAGVGVGALGEASRAATGPMRAAVTVAYARLWQIARERLDPKTARLRVAPSLVRDETSALWIAFGEDDEAVQRSAYVDDLLAGVLAAAEAWVEWGALRESSGVDDDFLFQLVDDGLLVHDGAPPLVGPPPLEWMRARHGAAIGVEDEAEKHAVLVHEGEVTLSRAAVERAAALAPLLFRLQEALAPPMAEHALDDGTRAALETTEEVYGTGAYALGALALGRWGTPLDAPTQARPRPQEARVVRAIVDAIVVALAAGRREVALDAEALAAACDEVDAPTPATFELMLGPAREPAGAAPGDGWLLGLHAPAGASWGRFLHAVGAPLVEAMAPIAARPGGADVSFAPSVRLGDLTAHPPLHAHTIALSAWPADEARAITPAALTLALDSARGAPSLQLGDEAVVPAPAWRVRSTTAPRGLGRLVVGLPLVRQHAPWALHLGALADLAFVPRLVLDGFVVAPASWRVPEALADAAALRRWREAFDVPAAVQAGQGDELRLVPLDGDGALAELAGEPRVYEVWPPLDASIDRAGRRLEAIVAVFADEDEGGPPALPPPPLPTVPLPTGASIAAGWHTWKLFGAADRQERLLHGAVFGALSIAVGKGLVERWFFLRYVDGPGRRDHIRLRVRAKSDDAAAEIEAILAEELEGVRAAGDLVAVEHAEYQRELGRYGADAIDAVEAVFESDSLLVSDLGDFPIEDMGLDPVEYLVVGYDALAAGAGLDAAARRELAARRRDAYGLGRDDALAAEYRARQKSLRARLHEPAEAFTAHTRRVAAALAPLSPERRLALLPPLLHLAANRLLGVGDDREAAAFYFWERARESLARHGVR